MRKGVVLYIIVKIKLYNVCRIQVFIYTCVDMPKISFTATYAFRPSASRPVWTTHMYSFILRSAFVGISSSIGVRFSYVTSAVINSIFVSLSAFLFCVLCILLELKGLDISFAKCTRVTLHCMMYFVSLTIHEKRFFEQTLFSHQNHL